MEATALAYQSDELSDRRRLLADIAAARLRIVAARNAFAGLQDSTLAPILSVQRILAEEKKATDRILVAIKSDADREVARILGPGQTGGERPDLQWIRGTASRLRVIEEGPSFDAGRDANDAHPVWLRSQLDRLLAKAEILERHAQVAIEERGSSTRDADTVLLDMMLSNVLEATREHHRRSRERAAAEAAERLAAARAEAARRTPSGALRQSEPPAASKAPPQTPHPASFPTEERPHGSQPVSRRASPSKSGSNRLKVADVLVPLIAIVIVLIVVLTWIG